jgi:hypothetical protein
MVTHLLKIIKREGEAARQQDEEVQVKGLR